MSGTATFGNSDDEPLSEMAGAACGAATTGGAAIEVAGAVIAGAAAGAAVMSCANSGVRGSAVAPISATSAAERR